MFSADPYLADNPRDRTPPQGDGCLTSTVLRVASSKVPKGLAMLESIDQDGLDTNEESTTDPEGTLESGEDFTLRQKSMPTRMKQAITKKRTTQSMKINAAKDPARPKKIKKDFEMKRKPSRPRPTAKARKEAIKSKPRKRSLRKARKVPQLDPHCGQDAPSTDTDLLLATRRQQSCYNRRECQLCL